MLPTHSAQVKADYDPVLDEQNEEVLDRNVL